MSTTDHQTHPGRRPLRLGEPELHRPTTHDNVELRLTRYRAGGKGPVIMAPGYCNSTYALTPDTIETNFPEYLFERGYDIWLLDYRASPALPSASQQYTADEIATQDYPTAVEKVKEVTGAEDVQVVAHCVGSMSLNMSLAAGLKGVRSAICSQVALHPKVVPTVELKTKLHLATLVKASGTKTMTTDYHPEHLPDRLLDMAMHAYPRERCHSPVCRRIIFIYGEVFRHDQINEATHEAVPHMFGVANLTFFQHMSMIFNKAHVVDAQGEETYLSNVQNMTVPITYIHGERNRFFPPEGTERTYQLLVQNNGPDLYRRIVFPGYAHMDHFMGKNAARDVFPVLHEELERFN
jgi:choline dehydrogenase-like flavoprotein